MLRIALPARFHGGQPWSATGYVEEIHAALSNQVGAAGGVLDQLRPYMADSGYCDRPGNFAGHSQSPHFLIEYDTNFGTGLVIDDYIKSLEDAYRAEVDDYGWHKPLLEAGRARYTVQIVGLGNALYGYVNPRQEVVKPNGVSSWASCMVLNKDYSWSSVASAKDTLAATAVHEFNHMVQFAYGDAHDVPRSMWYESTATWMEDEILPAIHSAFEFLWPAFEKCLGNYSNPNRRSETRQYTNWLFFRYVVEHNGGADQPGGGEAIIEKFWEIVGQGEEKVKAFDDALQLEGTTLAEQYHNFAIASRFMQVCNANTTPYCFAQADLLYEREGKIRAGWAQNHCQRRG